MVHKDGHFSPHLVWQSGVQVATHRSTAGPLKRRPHSSWHFFGHPGPHVFWQPVTHVEVHVERKLVRYDEQNALPRHPTHMASSASTNATERAVDLTQLTAGVVGSHGNPASG